MSKIAVIYWSGTGNTEAMAKSVVEGIENAGGDAVLMRASEFDPSMLEYYDGFAFGCPSMGAEELEEEEFAPMFEACYPYLKGRKIALFGSYGWGDGEWMRIWEDKCRKVEVVFAHEFVICNEAPDDDAKEACKGLGYALV